MPVPESEPEPLVLATNKCVALALASGPNNYRCPACGDLVDVAKREDILLHHDHVTHPERFSFAAKLP